MTDVDDFSDWHDRDRYEPSEPPEEWFEAEALHAHEREDHGGKPCTCPKPTEAELDAAWEERARQHREEDHGGGECDCEPPF